MSGQNRSSAVMQQRQEARDALDDFPTPMWATRALCDWLIRQGHVLRDKTVCEPCCNRGYMVQALMDNFAKCRALDVHDYGAGFTVEDYLFGQDPDDVDWTIANPPFRLAAQFIERALRTSTQGVAMFVRSAFLEGEARYDGLFASYPPTAVLQFSERVVLHKGAMRQKGSKYWDASANDGEGKMKTASSATAYSWIVWDVEIMWAKTELIYPVSELHWIPPCRAQFERQGDYNGLGDLAL